MQQFLATVYEALHGLQDTPLYRDQLYPPAGAVVLASSLVTVAMFYYLVGWFTARYVLVGHWVAGLLTNCVISMVVLWVVGRFVFGTWTVPPPLIPLLVIQGLYAAVLFSILSMLFKWWSPNARRTPF